MSINILTFIPFKLKFSLKDKAQWLNDILQAEEIKSPILIGQSMGGYVSQYFMELFPEHVGGFVSIDSAPLKKKYMTGAEIWMLKHTETMYRMYPWKALQRDGARGCSATEYGQNLMKEMMVTYPKLDYCKLTAHGYRILGEAIEADLPYEIDCPTILICGEEDKAGSTRRYNRKWAETENLPIYWVKGAGHNSNTDCPYEVNGIIMKFIESMIP